MKNEYFLNEMKELLQDEFETFLKTQEKEMAKSIRLNPLKVSSLELVDGLIKSRFDENSFYLNDDVKLGKHPFHLAGLYYLQEPSAACVVKALDLKENDWVLDLCAAPGGKTTQILSALHNTGLLFTNEINNNRCNILLSNIERWGADNYVLTNCAPENLCPHLTGIFDKVLVDAPCSGASMFKKYPETINDYNENSVKACAKRQAGILDLAANTLKDNGVLVYSTCTYNQIEDEQVIYEFLKRHPEFELVDTNLNLRKGIKYLDLDVTKLSRVFPMDQGEGHFVCKMIKHQETYPSKLHYLSVSKNKVVDEFLNTYFNRNIEYYIVKDKVYYCPKGYVDLKVNIVRSGILIGEIIKGRFEPHHHLFVSLLGKEYLNFCELNDQQVEKYLKGETLNIVGYKGYVQLKYQGYPIGFGKADGTIIKNKYPKGLRI